MPHSRRIQIGYCIDSFGIGGTELNAVRTVEALDLKRFEITIFHLHEDGPLRARYEGLGVRLVHLPISRLYAPRTAIQGLRLARIGNDTMAELCARHPDRFAGFVAAVSLTDVEGSVAEARRVIEIDEVLVAISASGLRQGTRVLNTSRFTSSFSVAASMTMSQSPNPA